MAQTQKLSQEEINSINDISRKYELIKVELGNIYIQDLNLNERKERAKNFYKDLQVKEQEIAKTLQEKYGKGTVNIETGEFNSLS